MRGPRRLVTRRRGLSAIFAVLAPLAAVALPAPPAHMRPSAGAPVKPMAAVGHDISGHDDSEGLKLIPATGETVGPASHCRSGQPVRSYDVVAIAVDVTLNRYLDHDPMGKMFVLRSQLPRVRAEEVQNAEARSGKGDSAVSLGLQGDAIQPLTPRAPGRENASGSSSPTTSRACR